MGTKLSKKKIEDFKEGQKISFLRKITRLDLDKFRYLTGDIDTLQAWDKIARKRGFLGRSIYDILLVSYLSELIGVHFPGENCLLQRLSLKFVSFAYVDDTLEIRAMVEQLSLGTRSMILYVTIREAQSHRLLVSGKIQVGFTKSQDKYGR
jgi:3-hydroxybutyryl-CoA dehydratase